MDMSGEYRIPATRDRVWAALNDPETLKQAIPGCEELTRLSDRELEATVRAKIGPVSARFSGRVTLSDLDPPASYRISGEGKGGAAGFAKGGAHVSLEPDGPSTVLRYTANAEVGGKLAQIGSRLVQGTSKKMADDFFSRFAAIVGADDGAAASPAGAAAAAAPVDVAPALGQAAAPGAGPAAAAPPRSAAAGVAQTGGTETGGAMAAGPGDASSQIARDPIGAEYPGTLGGFRPGADPDTGAVGYGNASVDQATQGMGDSTDDPLAGQTAAARAQAETDATAARTPPPPPPPSGTSAGPVAGRAASVGPTPAPAEPKGQPTGEARNWQTWLLWIAGAAVVAGAAVALLS